MQQMCENMSIHIHTFPWIYVSKYIEKCTNNHTSVDTRGWSSSPSRTQTFSSMLQFTICIPSAKKKLPKCIAWAVFSFADTNCYANKREQLLGGGPYLWTCGKLLNFDKERDGMGGGFFSLCCNSKIFYSFHRHSEHRLLKASKI